MAIVVCVKCDRIIRNYESAQAYKGKWTHRGRCPTPEERDKRSHRKIVDVIEDIADAVVELFD